MTILLLLISATILTIIFYTAFKANDNSEVSLIILFLIAPILGSFICLIYGTLTWLKTGAWGKVTVLDSLEYIINKTGASYNLLEKSPWVGLEKINELYINSNIGITLFFLPIITMLIATSIIDIQKRKNREERERKKREEEK